MERTLLSGLNLQQRLLFYKYEHLRRVKTLPANPVALRHWRENRQETVDRNHYKPIEVTPDMYFRAPLKVS